MSSDCGAPVFSDIASTDAAAYFEYLRSYNHWLAVVNKNAIVRSLPVRAVGGFQPAVARVAWDGGDNVEDVGRSGDSAGRDERGPAAVYQQGLEKTNAANGRFGQGGYTGAASVGSATVGEDNDGGQADIAVDAGVDGLCRDVDRGRVAAGECGAGVRCRSGGFGSGALRPIKRGMETVWVGPNHSRNVERRRLAKMARDARSGVARVRDVRRCPECVGSVERCEVCRLFYERDVAVARRQLMQATCPERLPLGVGGGSAQTVVSSLGSGASVPSSVPSLDDRSLTVGSSVSRSGRKEVDGEVLSEMERQITVMKEVVQLLNGEDLYLSVYEKTKKKEVEDGSESVDEGSTEEVEYDEWYD